MKDTEWIEITDLHVGDKIKVFGAGWWKITAIATDQKNEWKRHFFFANGDRIRIEDKQPVIVIRQVDHDDA